LIRHKCFVLWQFINSTSESSLFLALELAICLVLIDKKNPTPVEISKNLTVESGCAKVWRYELGFTPIKKPAKFGGPTRIRYIHARPPFSTKVGDKQTCRRVFGLASVKLHLSLTVAGQCRTRLFLRSVEQQDFTGLPPLCAVHPGIQHTYRLGLSIQF
jgi:hypothetical protein